MISKKAYCEPIEWEDVKGLIAINKAFYALDETHKDKKKLGKIRHRLMDDLYFNNKPLIYRLVSKLTRHYRNYDYEYIKSLYLGRLFEVIKTQKYHGVANVSIIAYGRTRDSIKSLNEKPLGLTGASRLKRSWLFKCENEDDPDHDKTKCKTCPARPKELHLVSMSRYDDNIAHEQEVFIEPDDATEEKTSELLERVKQKAANISQTHLNVVLYGQAYIKKHKVDEKIVKQVQDIIIQEGKQCQI